MSDFKNELKEILIYLKYCHATAEANGDVENAMRIGRAIIALQSDPYEEIFTEEFQKKYMGIYGE